MSVDQDLRALQRLAVGDPVERLRLAAALERAGRQDDVFDALVPGLSDPAVRTALARLPAWTHSAGGAGGTRWIDARPVRRTPRIRWRTTSTSHVLHGPIATAFGVVLVEAMDGPEADSHVRLVVLDPDTGARRWQADVEGEWESAQAVAHGEVVVVASRTSSGAFDVWTGRRLCGLPAGVVSIDRGLLLVRDSTGCVRAFEWTPPHAPDRLLWQAEGLGAFVVGGEVVLGRGDQAVHALDRSTGRTLWTLPTARLMSTGPVVDAHGALVHHVTLHEQEPPSRRYQHHLMSYAPSGEVLFDLRLDPPCVLTPTHFVEARSKGTAAGELLRFFDRRSGTRRGEFETGGWAYGTWPIAAAGDVVYVQSEPARPERKAVVLAGVRLDGSPLWRVELDVEAIDQLAAYPGRVYALATGGEVLCLEESG